MSLHSLGKKSPHLPSHDDYWVAPNAVLVGDVVLKKDASVWFGATIRGDNDPITIGERTNIQDGSVLHSDLGLPLTIGNDVTVGHMAMLHSCTIGDNSLIGIGAVILARAVIGKNTLVGAKALVTEGKTYPDGVLLMGAPAKVVRELTKDEIHALTLSAAHYVHNWQRFKAELGPDLTV